MNPDRERPHGPVGWPLRLRGQLVLELRRHVTTPLTHRLRLGPLRRVHRLKRRLHPERYTDADPFTLVRVDPDSITRSVLEWIPRTPQWGRVVGGTWDRRWERFEDRAVYRGLREHYHDGIPWRDTALYDAFLDQLERFGNAWGYGSLAEFDNRCTEIDRLYRSLCEHGYRTQRQVAGVERPRFAHIRDEINVDIGRDGTLYWRTYGQHRLALAKLLGLEEVPVVIHRRHRDWQRVRDRVRAGSDTGVRGASSAPESAVESHPDLYDVWSPR